MLLKISRSRTNTRSGCVVSLFLKCCVSKKHPSPSATNPKQLHSLLDVGRQNRSILLMDIIWQQPLDMINILQKHSYKYDYIPRTQLTHLLIGKGLIFLWGGDMLSNLHPSQQGKLSISYLRLHLRYPFLP